MSCRSRPFRIRATWHQPCDDWHPNGYWAARHVPQNATAQPRTQSHVAGTSTGATGARPSAATVCTIAVAAVVTWPSPASAQECAGEVVTICGFVWNDTNGNGIQDVGEIGIPEVKVQLSDGMDVVAEAYTDSTGAYQLDGPVGAFTLVITTSTVAVGASPSPTDATGDDFDSDGSDDTFGNSVVTVTIENTFSKQDFDFGFKITPMQQPGTGTPGYWKNHPGAWLVQTIVVGGVEYTKAQAIT